MVRNLRTVMHSTAVVSQLHCTSLGLLDPGLYEQGSFKFQPSNLSLCKVSSCSASA